MPERSDEFAGYTPDLVAAGLFVLDRPCIQCGRTFRTGDVRRKICSDECRVIRSRNQMRTFKAKYRRQKIYRDGCPEEYKHKRRTQVS